MADDKLRISRRTALQGITAAVGATALGCGGGEDGGGDAGAHFPTDAGNGQRDAQLDDAATIDAGPGDAGRPDPCAETSSLSPAELLAPIDTIVVLMMENRSFDHYLGSLRLIEGRAIDGLRGGEINPAPSGDPVAVWNLTDFTPADPPHGWDACHEQWNMGANDGFVRAHEGASQNDVMGYHVREQLPILYALADSGAICERWFCSVLGPTWPNRFYLHGATSNGIRSNLPAVGYRSIFQQLTSAGVSHANYFHDVAWAVGGYAKLTGNFGIDRFFEDAANGALPSFSIIDPQFFGAGANDDHPDHDIQLGQALISSIYSALAASPQWNRLLFVITYDEHGGFYDHVAPPTTTDERAEFRQLGFRVPSLVLGPHVRRGCAITTTFDHASVLRTLQTRFGIEPLNERMNAANDLSSCIQPSLIAAPAPPITLPRLAISRSRLLSRPPSAAHEELVAALRGVRIPAGMDRRSSGIGETEHVLRWGHELGALRVIR
ncbi:alkaline phosphatase family protein [Sandaracinus amylolyticus]|uniref:alkaline phosphatase family protein n=1 Tax=Sandaracinus amylolyticus TaxID=927083 RepID=UPI001F1664A3|nr:alkaline phosphatase family protein [Sandaracinus amylolyticus]UJR83149.1 Hypothetical protein I5071_52150 [Sandaracinus amylolyticus]